MMYNRHLYVNGEEIYLDEEEVIALNKQANDIAELKGRDADFTTDFKIPMTRSNVKILGHANLLNASSDAPYRRLSMTYIQDGVELISGGYLAITGSVEGYFKAVGYFGNADFFKNIEMLKLSNLNLSDLDHTYGIGVLSTGFETARPDMKYLTFEPSESGDLLKDNITLDHFRPFVKISRLFTEIVKQQGWTIDGDISFIKEWLLCQNLKGLPANNLVTFLLYNPPLTSSERVYLTSSHFRVTQTTFNFLGRYVFRPTRKGKFLITLSGKFYFTNASAYVFYLNDTAMASNTNGGIVQDFKIEYELTVGNDEINEPYIISSDFDAPVSGKSVTFYSYQVDIRLTESDVQVGDKVSAASTLPDLEQTKLLKSVANQYGLCFEADSTKRVLKVWRFEDLNRHIPEARDWSSYLEDGTEEMAYKFGSYAQSNVMKYKEVDDVPNGYGDGALLIDNQNLDLSKDLFTLDFAPAQDIVTLGGKIGAKIPLYTRKEDGTYEDKQLSDARVVLYEDVQKNLTVKETVGGNTVTLNTLHLAYFLGDKGGLGFGYSLISDHYRALGRMLDRCKTLTVKAALPLAEVQQLKHYIPVYSKRHGAYFYVNKVTGWRRDKKCTVELIKIA